MNEENFINIRKLPPLTRLVYTIGQLPTSYLMSMTYEEQLIWLCNYLAQTVIPTINNNADLVVELENYIKNLDLDSEVRAVIDEMVEDGTLEEILNQEVLGEINDKIDALETATENLPTDEADIVALKKFNSYTNKPLKYGKLTLPTEFSHYNFDLFREYDGTITDNLDLSKYDSEHIIYVNRDTGNDTSGTGSSEAPYKTIKKALTSITNSSTYDTYKIVCKTYRFYRNEFINESQADELYTMYKNIIIEPDDLSKQIIVATDQETLSWTSDGNGVYHATRSNVRAVYNMKMKDVYGCFKEISAVSSLQSCQETADTYYISGSTIYIHTLDGATPTTDRYLITLKLPTGQFNIRGNLFLRLRNITFYVSGHMSFTNSSTSYENTLICENVNIFKTADNNGFSIDDVKYVYMINCKTGYNFRDGFNYHYTGMNSSDIQNAIVYENKCVGFENGITDPDNTNNNCSSIHEGANIIRVNGVYQNSKGPVIADVGSAHTLMENCKVNQQYNYNAFSFYDATGSNTGKAYLIDCTSLQSVNISLNGSDDFKIRLINFHGNYENSDLDIALWTE